MKVKKTLSSFWSKAGFYIVLGACAAVVTATAVYTGRRPQPSVELPTLPPAAVISTPQATQALAAVTPAPTQETPFAVILPCDGEILCGYTEHTAVYNETLQHYTTHCALDIAASEMTAVRACADGTVTSVCTDPLWGGHIVIRHRDGYVSVCDSLGDISLVRPGDPVSQGQTVGFAGTALCEQYLGSHVHFMIFKDDIVCDPTAFIG